MKITTRFKLLKLVAFIGALITIAIFILSLIAMAEHIIVLAWVLLIISGLNLFGFRIYFDTKLLKLKDEKALINKFMNKL